MKKLLVKIERIFKMREQIIAKLKILKNEEVTRYKHEKILK